MTRIVKSTDEIETDRVATLDLGGTLIKRGEMYSPHKEIHTALGIPEEVEEQTYKDSLSYDGSLQNKRHAMKVNFDIAKHLDVSNPFETYVNTIQDIRDDFQIIDGAEKFVSDLKDAGYETCILSSAPKALTRTFAEDLNADTIYRWKDYEFAENYCRFYLNPEGENGKSDIVKALQEQGVEVTHFGNGGNDIDAVKAADHGLRQWNWTKYPDEAYTRALNEVDRRLV